MEFPLKGFIDIRIWLMLYLYNDRLSHYYVYITRIQSKSLKANRPNTIIIDMHMGLLLNRISFNITTSILLIKQTPDLWTCYRQMNHSNATKIIYINSGDLVMHDIIWNNMDMKLFYKDDQEERIDNECKLLFI